MTTQDLSRHLFQPAKRYSGARMQQGRVVLDSDMNEGELLADEGHRAVMADAIGPHGSSTAGFTILMLKGYDFQILPGSYFLGGLRFDIEAPQRFLGQQDWRQSSRSDQTLPLLPEAARHDLVYLVGWEQTVSAVEDLELVEHALGGRDTTVRLRRMRRVYVRTNTSEGCGDAFDELVAELCAGGVHSFDARNHELKSGARLRVVAAEVEPSEDLCSSDSSGGPGYSGGESQAIRVQMIAADRFLWAYNNASPLFRVTAVHVAGSTTITLTFLNAPQEQALFPLKDQILEILPWGADLANGEHIADHPIADDIGGGIYTRVASSYNPATRTLIATIDAVDTPRFAAMVAWFTSLPADQQRFFFLRVWNAGGTPETGHGFTIDEDPVPLPGTGLAVQIDGPGIIGDHWIIAARPATPATVVPWDLQGEDGAPPHGPRRYYCPLGMLHWSFNTMGLQVESDSCRRPFAPLTRQGGCSSVTVGDGVTSFGDYTSIQDAVDALPADEPAKICLLAGLYEERVVIKRRFKSLLIEGCGPRTVIRTPPGNATSDGLISLVFSVDVTLRNFRLEAVGQRGITMQAELEPKITWCGRITLDKLDVETRRDPKLPLPGASQLAVPTGSAAFPLSTVVGRGTYDVKLLRCTFTQIGDLSAAANVLFGMSTGLVVRDCKIVSPPAPGATTSKAWAGLHIAGACSDVLVERCRIEGGLGHGITLGSVHSDGETSDPTKPYDPGGHLVMAPTDDCPAVLGGFDVLTAPTRDDPPVFVPDDGPHDVRIERNQIRDMGGSGISVLGFWPERQFRVQTLEQIQTRDLLILDNLIEQNCTHMPETSLPPGLRAVAAFGGIILADADGLRIHDNRIHGNGLDHRHPICGIYVLHGENVTVENNQIRDNGRRVPGRALAGHRAGIALQMVGRELFTGRDFQPLDLTQPAARVRGNTVVQPAGRALQIYGLGPMYVEGNVLASEGLDGIDSTAREYAAHCIEIQNLGQSPELALAGVIPADIAIFPGPFLPLDPAFIADELVDGRILFTDNVVRFNPVAGAAHDIFCVTRLQSYGDVAALNNQFYARLPAAGLILQDTIVTAWSTRTSHNRWENPAHVPAAGLPHPTQISAMTMAHLNITTLNQASRCIHAETTLDLEGPDAIADNQIFDDDGCGLVIPGLMELLGPSSVPGPDSVIDPVPVPPVPVP